MLIRYYFTMKMYKVYYNTITNVYNTILCVCTVHVNKYYYYRMSADSLPTHQHHHSMTRRPHRFPLCTAYTGCGARPTNRDDPSRHHRFYIRFGFFSSREKTNKKFKYLQNQNLTNVSYIL